MLAWLSSAIVCCCCSAFSTRQKEKAREQRLLCRICASWLCWSVSSGASSARLFFRRYRPFWYSEAHRLCPPPVKAENYKKFYLSPQSQSESLSLAFFPTVCTSASSVSHYSSLFVFFSCFAVTGCVKKILGMLKLFAAAAAALLRCCLLFYFCPALSVFLSQY